jgi:L-lysine exporter family protein LysE/ArgO
MPSSALLLANGLLLGLGAAAPIGPVNVEIARRTLRFGPAAGMLLGCGAVTVDVAYAILTSLTVIHVLQYPKLTTTLTIAAALFLTYLAILCFKSAAKGHDIQAEPAPQSKLALAKHYTTGLLMTALNPMTLAFWFLAVPGSVAKLTAQPRRDLPLVCAGVFLGAFAWVCFFTTLVGRIRRLGNTRWLVAADLLGGTMLLAFALLSIWRLLASPL